MNKISLYQIETQYLDLINQVEDLDGEITEEVGKALEINESQLQGKAIAYKEVIAIKEDFNARIDAEIKRLQAIKKTNNNLIGRLKDNLLTAVQLFGEFTVGTVTFGTRKSSSVEVTINVNELPNLYKNSKVTETADRAKIKEALKAGTLIEGCRIKESINLNIK